MSKRESVDPPCRLLIVEDDWLIAGMIEEQLTELDLEIAGVATSVAEALRLIETVEIDAALLDMKLHEEFAGDVADALEAHGIPFLFVSGYPKAPDPRYDSVPILLKPFDVTQLKTAVEGVLPPKCLPEPRAADASNAQPTPG
jgi:two-component SAPR family response regulator